LRNASSTWTRPGVCLVVCIASSPLTLCSDLNEEGIFRVAAAKTKTQALIKQFEDNGGNVDLEHVNPDTEVGNRLPSVLPLV
jgi:hypothetical protein